MVDLWPRPKLGTCTVEVGCDCGRKNVICKYFWLQLFTDSSNLPVLLVSTAKRLQFTNLYFCLCLHRCETSSLVSVNIQWFNYCKSHFQYFNPVRDDMWFHQLTTYSFLKCINRNAVTLSTTPENTVVHKQQK